MQRDESQTSNTKHEFVKRDIIRRIDGGEFSESGRVPSENELSKSYGVSVITARKALENLVMGGRIVRIKGKGSFLTEKGAHVAARRKKQTGLGTVSLLLTSYEESDSSLMSIMRGAHSVLSDNGYTMTVEYSERGSHSEPQILERALNEKVAGVMVFAADSGADLSKLIVMEQSGIPFVMLDRGLKNHPCTLVASYHFDGMFKMVGYLAELGHRKIAYVSDGIFSNEQEDRLLGYKMALERRGIAYSSEIVFLENYPQTHLLPALIAERRITAIASVNDRAALNIAACLKKEGIRIPQDVSLTGFDDSALSSYADLTTARQAFYEIGALGAKKLIEKIQKGLGNSQTYLPVELVVRGSTQKFEE